MITHMKSQHTIFVTGGAGYIGSHMVKYLLQRDYKVVVLDNLSTGHQDAVLTPYFYEGDYADVELLEKILSEHKIECVLHFAALSNVAESTQKQADYYANNVRKLDCFIQILVDHDIKSFIFSSSAAVYGEPDTHLISECENLVPINPYGMTKRQGEKLLSDYYQAAGFNSISLRYFNAAGADPDGELSERHEPETHLIPRMLDAFKTQIPLEVFGNDYPTHDGSCIRDYVHVWDLCAGHYSAMQSLFDYPDQCEIYNLGAGRGYSVFDIVAIGEELVGKPISLTIQPRRAGDPAQLIANIDKASSVLGWYPERSDLRSIILDTQRARFKT